MGEGHKDVEESSVRVCAIVQSRLLLMRDMVATKTYPKFLAILMEKHKHLSSCWQVVRTRAILLFRTRAFNDCEAVQCRDLASTMRSALTTRSLANCASLILKTVSIIMRCVPRLP